MKKIFFLLIMAGFTIGMTEILLLKFAPRYYCNTVSQFQYDDTVGVTAKPDFKTAILTDHIIETYTNDIGARNYLNKDELMKYEKIIFCVGDSFTEGVGNLTDESYPFYLDLILNSTGGGYEKKYAVLNLGLGGYGSIQSFLTVKKFEKILNRKPDAVIYFVTSNDLTDDEGFEAKLPFNHIVSKSPRYNEFFVALNEYFEYSQIYYRMKLLIHNICSKVHKNKPDVIQKQVQVNFKPEQLSGLNDMAEYSKANNIHLIISGSDCTVQTYELLKDYASGRGVIFADYRMKTNAISGELKNLPVFNSHSGQHFRPWINYMIACMFAEEIRKLYA